MIRSDTCTRVSLRVFHPLSVGFEGRFGKAGCYDAVPSQQRALLRREARVLRATRDLTCSVRRAVNCHRRLTSRQSPITSHLRRPTCH